MFRLLRAAVPVALLMVLATTQGAMAATTHDVSIVNFSFTPQNTKARLGDIVKWTNNAGVTPHTSTSDGIDACCANGAALWQSGTLSGGQTFQFTFNTAGTYGYHCSIHTTMKGTVQTALFISPKIGGVTTSFKIGWALGTIPTGYNMDVQISRPGGPGFVDWKVDQTGTQTRSTFTPDAGTGVYLFRARLQMGTSTTIVSGFSPSGKITVS